MWLACRYNALVYVPYQLERLLWFGTLICCDSFLVRKEACRCLRRTNETQSVTAACKRHQGQKMLIFQAVTQRLTGLRPTQGRSKPALGCTLCAPTKKLDCRTPW